MSSETVSLARQAGEPPRITLALQLAIVGWWALAALMIYWPDKPVGFAAPRFVSETHQLFVLLAAALTLAVLAGRFLALSSLLQPLRRAARWLIALALLLAVWEFVTAKLALLPAPFFAPPRALIEAWAT
ncbi:sulfonate ABC transporter permease, partial [Winslowiella iniecta]